MAHMWTMNRAEAASGRPPEWLVAPLDAELFEIGSGVPVAMSPQTTACAVATSLQTATASARSFPALVRIQDTGADAWALLGSEEVFINGVPLLAGIALLRDRDEVQLGTPGGERTQLFFSTERLAVVEPCPGGEQVVRCPRCKDAIERGASAVRCPQCRVWHHQTGEKPCWTYAPRCTLCDQPTSLEGTYRWTPSDL